MSCPKLRELHPEAAALGVCTCEFSVRGRGYPTPLLFALKPGEIPAFRKPQPVRAPARPAAGHARRGSSPAAATATAETSAAALRRRAEETVEKLTELHRHRRGVEASIERLHGELAAMFDAADTDTLDLATGRLRRGRRAGGEGWDFLIEL